MVRRHAERRESPRDIPTPIVALRSFEVFYSEEFPKVVSLCYAISRRRWAAEETAQEAFYRAFRNWERIGAYDRPGAWVRRVALNLSVSRIRKLRSEALALVRNVGHEVQSDINRVVDDDLWAHVRRLPRREAQTIALFYVEDRSVAEIASILEIGESTVRVHLTNARRRLAKQLRIDGGSQI